MSNAWSCSWSAEGVHVKVDTGHRHCERAATRISGGSGKTRSFVSKMFQSSVRPEILEKLMGRGEGVSQLSYIINYDQISHALVCIEMLKQAPGSSCTLERKLIPGIPRKCSRGSDCWDLKKIKFEMYFPKIYMQFFFIGNVYLMRCCFQCKEVHYRKMVWEKTIDPC